jgi:hypothetical protein
MRIKIIEYNKSLIITEDKIYQLYQNKINMDKESYLSSLHENMKARTDVIYLK